MFSIKILTSLIHQALESSQAVRIGISGALRTTLTMELNAILHTSNMDKGPREASSDNLEHCFAEPTPSGLFSAHIISRDMWLGMKLWTRGF